MKIEILFRKILMNLVFLLFVLSVYGQTSTTSDTAKINWLKLYCYQQKEERSIVKSLFENYKYRPIKTTNDTVLNSGLKLCCYEQLGEKSIEKFAQCPAACIPTMFIRTYREMPLSHRCQEYFRWYDISIFINADSSEILLVAKDSHNPFGYRYAAFCIASINKDNAYILENQWCVHTEYKHFVSEGGCGIGMTKKKLLSIKGSDYVVPEDGHWKYSYISNSSLNNPKILMYYNRTGDGDVLWDFFFDGENVVCIIITHYWRDTEKCSH